MAKICQSAIVVYLHVHTSRQQNLLFMGNEFAQTKEWNYKSELEWDLLQYVSHGGMKYCVQKLNELYETNLLYTKNNLSPAGLNGLILTKGSKPLLVINALEKSSKMMCCCFKYDAACASRLGNLCKRKRHWKEIFNSNSKEFWGTGDVYNPDIKSELVDEPTKAYKLKINLPALGGVVLR